jgi:hypothetical protein
MKLNAALIITSAVALSFAACKRESQSTLSQETGKTGSTKMYPGSAGNENPISANAPRAEGRQAPAGEKGGVAAAHIASKDNPSFTGMAKLHDVNAGTGMITIDVKNATAGIYSVYIFDASSCTSLPIMDVESNQIAQGSSNKPDKLAGAGVLTVIDDGTGHLEATLTDLKGSADIKSFDGKVIALFPKKAPATSGAPSPTSAGTSTGVSAEGCGVLNVGRAQEFQG